MPGGERDGALYIGLDSSTQSLSAVVLEARGEARDVVFQTALNFDEVLPGYGTAHGVLPGPDPAVAVSSPVMWAEALDVMMARISGAGLDMSRLRAISGSAQQHGSVYLNAEAEGRLAALDPARPLAEQVAPMLSRQVAPIWMDSSTSRECAEIAGAVGGNDVLAGRTGSRAFERFTGPQIRKFFADNPEGYAATARIHLVSSFLATLLAGHHAPVDPGDASGTNLMDLAANRWWAPALEATAPGLLTKLPPIAPAWTTAARLSPYWRRKYGLPAARVIAWSGDNPCSLIGVGLVREGRIAISLGTSDTVFGLMTAPRVDRGGTGHVFGAPTGDYMGLTCFSNGSLARERVRDAYGFSWAEFSRALEATPPGNGGRVLLPWFAPEITPPVDRPAVHRFGLAPGDAPANVRAVVESQQMAMAIHSSWMGVTVDVIQATGGAAANPQILQVMADVFGAEVHSSEAGNSAALGAAFRAVHAERLAEEQPMPWEKAVALATPAAPRVVTPHPGRQAIYRDLLPIYAACEAHALDRGPDPSPLLARFASDHPAR